MRCYITNLKRVINEVRKSYVYWIVHHLDSWIKRDQLDVTCFILSLFNAQHVSDVNTSILRSLRLICWVVSWAVLIWFDVCWCYVVVWLGWYGIRVRAEAWLRLSRFELVCITIRGIQGSHTTHTFVPSQLFLYKTYQPAIVLPFLLVFFLFLQTYWTQREY